VPTFFSLTPKDAEEYRQTLFTQIHEIVFHGGGGYDWNTIYDMPIWLRAFTFKKLVDHFEAKNKAEQGAQGNDIQKGRDILKQAQRADPANAQKHRYTDKFAKKPSKTPSKPNIPDFITKRAQKG
jgi:hypothetical protein